MLLNAFEVSKGRKDSQTTSNVVPSIRYNGGLLGFLIGTSVRLDRGSVDASCKSLILSVK